MKKFMMIALAAATLGTAAVASTSASAYWPGGWGPHWGPHYGWGGPHWGGYWGGYGYGYGGYVGYSPCHWTPYPFPHKVCYY